VTSGQEDARRERIPRRPSLGLKRAWHRTRLGREAADDDSEPESSPDPAAAMDPDDAECASPTAD